jgi:AcrR family transcriptional regulator
MTATPWGEVGRLREQAPAPRADTDRETVRSRQRRLLMAAVVTVVAERGYADTRVADLLEVSGVSRNAFYREFANKQECFMTTLDALATVTGAAVRDAYTRADGSWDERLSKAFETVARLVVEQPSAARIGLVEVYAAGPEALERMDKIDAKVGRAVSRGLRNSPAQAGMPRDVVLSVLGGLRKVLYTRLREGREDELQGLVPEMLAWALSYETPPGRLRRPRKVPARLAAGLPEPTDGRERILRAVTELVAEKGYQSLVITDIAERAAVSLSTFYQHFDGKEAVFLATLAEAQQQVFQQTLPVFSEAEDWPHAVAAGAHGFLATHPAMAQLGGFSVWATSPAGLDLRAQGLALFSALLDEGFRQFPDTSPAAREGVGASIDALLFDTLRHKGAEKLYSVAPTAAFIALAPFVGSERAFELANEGG